MVEMSIVIARNMMSPFVHAKGASGVDAPFRWVGYRLSSAARKSAKVMGLGSRQSCRSGRPLVIVNSPAHFQQDVRKDS